MTGHPKVDFVRVSRSEDINNGEKILLDIEGRELVLIKIQDIFYAVADICTHDRGSLGDGELDGCELICPRHGARFDIRDGTATRLPAVSPIPIFPTRIVDGWVEVGITGD